MKSRAVNPTLAAQAQLNQEADSRLTNLLEDIATAPPPPPETKAAPTESKKEAEFVEDLQRLRQVSLPVQAQATLTIQLVGEDVYVVDGKLKSIPEGSFNSIIGSILFEQLHPSVKQLHPSGWPKEFGTTGTAFATADPGFCYRSKCSRRLQRSGDGLVLQKGYVTNRWCGRSPCSTANRS